MANNKKSARRYVGPLRGIRIFLDRYVDRRGKRPGAIFVPRKRPPHFALCVAVTTMKLLVAFTLIFGFVCAGTLFGIASSYINTAPELDLSAISNTAVATEIRDANGVLLTTYSNGTNRMWASYDELPQNLINAVVATEDARFSSIKA